MTSSRGTKDGSRRIKAATLTRRGALFVVAALVGVFVAYQGGRPQLLYIAAFLALLPIAGALLVRARPLRLSVTRTFSPPVVTAGLPANITLEVRNLSAFPTTSAVWSDRIPWGAGVAGPGTLPPLPAASRLSMRAERQGRTGYTVHPPQRGVYEIGPLDVKYTDPFGLVAARTSVGMMQPLYVVPAVVPLEESGRIHIAGDGTARLIQRMATGSDDDLMTREYRRGDALRRVHWRASARHGELMVRQEEQRSYPEARVLLDTRLDGYGYGLATAEPANDGSPAFEWAVSMLASVVAHLHRAGFLVEVVETGPRQLAPLGDAGQGAGQDVEFMLSLAGLRLVAPRVLASDHDEMRAQGVQGPIFAIVADPSSDALRWVTAQRRPYESGVAFVLNGAASKAVTTLSNAGWTCVPVSATDNPSTAWSNATRITESSSGQRA